MRALGLVICLQHELILLGLKTLFRSLIFTSGHFPHGLSALRLLLTRKSCHALLQFRVRDAAEDKCLLEGFTISERAHRMVAEAVQALREWSVLDGDPRLLVEQEQMDVIQEWRAHLLALLVVAAANYKQRLVRGQVRHGVADTTARR